MTLNQLRFSFETRSWFAVLGALSKRPLFDPQADLTNSRTVRPFMAEGSRCSQTLSNVRVGSIADLQRHAHLRPLSGVKRTSNVRF